jgi:Fe2+ transport system protein FeoA
MCPLTLCHAGEKVKVERIAGGREACCRLKAMGLFPGEEVEIVSSHCGPVVLNVKGFRLALGCGMAQKILVSPLL